MKTEKHVVILWLIISLLLPTLACAQYKFDNVLYGAAYYHEYMPTDRLDKDIQMMKDCGLSVVRVGESSWGLFEPREPPRDVNLHLHLFSYVEIFWRLFRWREQGL